MILGMRVRVAFLPLCLLAACATSPDTRPAEANATTTCVREYRVGSNIPVLTCSEAQTEAERQILIDEVNRALPSPAPQPKGGGGG